MPWRPRWQRWQLARRLAWQFVGFCGRFGTGGAPPEITPPKTPRHAERSRRVRILPPSYTLSMNQRLPLNESLQGLVDVGGAREGVAARATGSRTKCREGVWGRFLIFFLFTGGRTWRCAHQKIR